MRDSKLFSVINSFSAIELNRLEKFVISPYFNVNNDLTSLFYECKKLAKSKKTKTKSTIWSSIFSTEYVDKKFRKLNTDLLKLIEEFLALEEYKSNPLHQANYLLEAVHSKKIAKLTNTSLSAAERLSSRQIKRPTDYYFYQYQLEKNKYNLTNVEQKRISKKNVASINLPDIVENLDYFYLGEKLKYYCTLLSWQKLMSSDFEVLFIDEIITIVEGLDPDECPPPIAIYYRIYKTIVEEENLEHYYKLKTLIKDNIQIFSESEAKNIVDSIINYCLKKVNTGRIEFMQELFENYNYGLENDLIIINNQITPWTFKNLVGVSLRIKDFEWTKNFILKYESALPDQYREGTVALCKAQLAFYTKDFDEVLYQLQQVDFQEFNLKINAQMTLIATYFELKLTDSLLNSCDAIIQTVRRAKNVSNQKKVLYINFVKYVKLLSKYNQPQNVLIELKTKIKNEKDLPSKTWLLEKVSELLK